MPTPLHRAARRLTRRLGAHGAGLLLVATLWWLIGLRVLLQPAPRPIGGILALIPDEIQLSLWWGAALLCLGAAIDRDGPRRDAFALTAAITVPALYATSYIGSWIVGATPIGWYVGILYCVPVALVGLVAAIPDERPEQ